MGEKHANAREVLGEIQGFRNYAKKRLSLNPFLLVIVSAFVLYLCYLSSTSITFNFNLISRLSPYIASTGIWPLTPIASWLISEIFGGIGVFVRLGGGLFAFYFVLLLIRKKRVQLDVANRAIILEAVHYLFFIPWILFLLFGSSGASVFSRGKYVGFSYLAQLLLVFPSLIMLSFKIKKRKGEENHSQILRWLGIAAPLFVIALWVRHALFWVYALWANGANLNSLVQIIGFSNSMFTLLIAAIATIIVCIPLVQGRNRKINPIQIGGILTLIGAHFAIYDIIAIVEPLYLSFLSLTEFWYVILPILGFGLLVSNNRRKETHVEMSFPAKKS